MIRSDAEKVTLASVTQNGARLSTLYLASLALALFLHVPAMMFLIELDRADLFVIWLLLIEGARLVFFLVLVRQRRKPGAMLTLRAYSISPRVFFPAAMLSFAYAGAPRGTLIIIAILWAAIEWRCKIAADDLPPATTLRHLQRTGALTREKEGWLYRLDNGTADLVAKGAKGRTPLMEKVTRTVLPFIIIAPGLFLYSQRLGDNFDARAAIMGAFCIVIGWLSMPVLIGTRLSQRALNLLAHRGDAAFVAKPEKDT